jgi:hypothetical protein
MVGGLVNRKGVPASKVNLVSLGAPTRSVEFYTQSVNLPMISLARAKVHLKNGSAIAESLAMRNLHIDITVGKRGCLESSSVVDFPRVYPITESNYIGKLVNNIYQIVSIVKCGHSVKHLIGDRALLKSVSLLTNPIYSKPSGESILVDNGGKIVAQANALRNGRDKLNATLLGGYGGL